LETSSGKVFTGNLFSFKDPRNLAVAPVRSRPLGFPLFAVGPTIIAIAILISPRHIIVANRPIGTGVPRQITTNQSQGQHQNDQEFFHNFSSSKEPTHSEWDFVIIGTGFYTLLASNLSPKNKDWTEIGNKKNDLFAH